MTDHPGAKRRFTTAKLVSLGLAAGLLVFGSAFLGFAFVADTELGHSISTEDGLVEVLGAGSFLTAAMLFLILFGTSDVPRARRLFGSLRRNPFYLALAVMLIFAFGEEISWGQRIFGWATPDAFAVANEQSETNIHNLQPFHGGASLLNVSRLGNLFWVLYCVAIPLSSAALPRIASVYRRISLPVAPLWVAGLFVGCWTAFRLYIAMTGPTLGDPNELKEACLAMCFVVLAAAQLRSTTMADRGERSSDRLTAISV